MEFCLITAATGFAILYVLCWSANFNKDYWKNQGVPYVKSTPIFGVMKDLILMRKGLGEIFNDIYHQFEGNKFVGYFQFTAPSIMIRDPDIINRIMIKDFSHFEDRGPPLRNTNDLFGMAFGNLTGDDWRKVRHIHTRSFSSSKLKTMFEPMKEFSDKVVIYLSDKTNTHLEVREVMLRYVINVIGNVAFGLKINTLNQTDKMSVEFYNQTSLFFKPSISFLIKLLITMTFPKLKDMLNLNLTDIRVNKFFTKLAKDIINYRQMTGTKRDDFIQLLIDEKNLLYNSSNDYVFSEHKNKPKDYQENDKRKCKPNERRTSGRSAALKEILTEEFIAAQTFIFISGGSESVAAALSFVIFEMAQNQKLQKKVQNEIDEILSKHEFNYESINKLTYMEQFINEALRLHPLGPGIIRICTKDYKIPGCDVVIKKGTIVNIPVGGLQMDPLYFPEPNKFDPDRFSNMDNIPKSIFLPFGSGPRICIAKRLSMLEMKVILAKLLSKYTITLSERTKVPLKIATSAFLVSVEGGIFVKFHKREV